MVDYVVHEIPEGGQLFNFMHFLGPLEEPVARYFFKQLIIVLQYCHDKDIAHRDLKPDNIWLDEKFNLRISGFEFSGPVDEKPQEWLYNYCHIWKYLPPEVNENDGEAFTGEKVDIFSAAIILFMMIAQEHPFNGKAVQNNLFYQNLAFNRPDVFWNAHCEMRPDCITLQSHDF